MKKVFIANRGEIASRIEKACIQQEIDSCVAASEVDVNALYAQQAREVAILPGKSALETYLDIELIISKAQEHECDAIHPGYGFLSENAEFSRKVVEAGLTFIGPTHTTIEMMGDKQQAKAIAEKAGVPLAPSVAIDAKKLDSKAIAEKVGFPLLLKASAGGGGRGMRIVRDAASLPEEIERAQAEAKKFFSDERIFAERYIELPRHVEVQVFGDSHGNAVHFGTRDCSAQRRHQKLVEEAPAPFLSEEVREALHAHAVSLTKAAEYIGAGTVEFLVKGNDIFFLEMNTRIQVEHPVTEEAYGVDLVSLQLDVARGEPLPEELHNLSPQFHAIEYRIYAENPTNNFAPDLGKIQSITKPSPSEWFREDGSVADGSEISPYYDALLTKVIIVGANRDEALARSRYILREYHVVGLHTTIPFHLWLLYASSFTEAPVPISYVEQHFSADDLECLHTQYQVDSAHRAYGAKWSEVETIELSTNARSEKVAIEIVHRVDGLFLARIAGSDSSDARVSTTREHVIELVHALI